MSATNTSSASSKDAKGDASKDSGSSKDAAAPPKGPEAADPAASKPGPPQLVDVDQQIAEARQQLDQLQQDQATVDKAAVLRNLKRKIEAARNSVAESQKKLRLDDAVDAKTEASASSPASSAAAAAPTGAAMAAASVPSAASASASPSAATPSASRDNASPM